MFHARCVGKLWEMYSIHITEWNGAKNMEDRMQKHKVVLLLAITL